MKLAEALILRADNQKRLLQLKQRVLRNVKVQEGDQPAENPQVLIQELERVAAELQRLIQQINRTNSVTMLDGDVTLSDALAERDVLKLRHGAYREIAQSAAIVVNRLTRSEVRYETAVNVPDIERQADNLARAHRELDARIQAANWTTELIET
ncbi:MAG: DIP1984 family protein [Chloroflexota bacterium]